MKVKNYKTHPVWTEFLPLITWQNPPFLNNMKVSGNWDRIESKEIEVEGDPLPQQKYHLVV